MREIDRAKEILMNQLDHRVLAIMKILNDDDLKTDTDIMLREKILQILSDVAYLCGDWKATPLEIELILRRSELEWEGKYYPFYDFVRLLIKDIQKYRKLKLKKSYRSRILNKRKVKRKTVSTAIGMESEKKMKREGKSYFITECMKRTGTIHNVGCRREERMALPRSANEAVEKTSKRRIDAAQ